MKHLLVNLQTNVTRIMLPAESIQRARICLWGMTVLLIGMHNATAGEMTGLINSNDRRLPPYRNAGPIVGTRPAGNEFWIADPGPVSIPWQRRPTPSSDLPPSSISSYSGYPGYPGWLPFSPPIPHMPAGPLQVW